MDRAEQGVVEGIRRHTRLDEADGTARVARLDYGTLGKVRRTPQGGVIAPARLTRTGVFRYLNHDGTERRELRLPEEVFKADSLATLADAPVTDGHPAEPVTTKNFSKFSRGHMRGDAKADGKFVAAELTLQDADLIAKVERGDLREVSCGYTCRLEYTSGEYEGERYDAIQRDIEHNHIALVHKGRAGREVSLRLDAAEQVDSSESGSRRHDAGDERKQPMAVYRIDGVDYEVGSPQFLQALEKRSARIDGELVEVKAKAEKLEGERDGLKTKLDASEKALKAATDPAAIAAAVKARVDLEQDARAIGGDEMKLDGLTDREVMVKAIKHVDADFEPGERSDDYIRGRFETLAETHRADDEEGGRGIDAARAAARKAKKRTDDDERDEREDDDDAPDADKAERDYLKRRSDASSKPFRVVARKVGS